MADELTIRPAPSSFDVTLSDLPGSKSVTNRALLLAALSDGVSTLSNVLFSDDTLAMLNALKRLGFTLRIDEDGRVVTVEGRAGRIPAREAMLHLGNAGTAMRSFAAVCCLGEGTFALDGIPRMRERPIGELIDALTALGANVVFLRDPGYPPVRIEASGLSGGEIEMGRTQSSQFISALLMAAPGMRRGLTVRFKGPITSRPYVALTVALMRRFGAEVDVAEDWSRLRVEPGTYQPVSGESGRIEPDASNASYFLGAAAACPGSRVAIAGLGRDSVQGDVSFVEVLERMGARVRVEANRVSVAHGGDPLRGVDRDMNAMPDVAMTLAALGAVARGGTWVRNVGNWRVKETDRMAAMQRELEKLGARVTVEADDFHVEPAPGERFSPAVVDTYDDHRMAMCFGMLGLIREGVTLRDPACVNKTFPDFFSFLDRLRDSAAQTPSAPETPDAREMTQTRDAPYTPHAPDARAAPRKADGGGQPGPSPRPDPFEPQEGAS